MQAGSPPTNPESDAPVVTTPGGPVTLVDLDRLESRIAEFEKTSAREIQEAKSLEALLESRLVDIGTWLLDHPSEWTPPSGLESDFRTAQALRARLQADESQLDSVKAAERRGVGGLVAKVGAWRQTHKLAADRDAISSQLRNALVRLGKDRLAPDLEPLAALRTQAAAAESQAQALRADSNSLSSAAQRLQDEVRRRHEAQAQMGFDSLYQAAYLQTYGPQAVEAPLNLKRGERAVLVVAARLARNRTRTRYVGRSQGFSFPIGHTGIRYRIGSFQGQPVEQQVLSPIDNGSLVLTDQRLAFVGQTKSTSTPLAKLVHVECYADALAVFHEGRENADYYFVASPKYTLFMINWALEHLPA